MAGLRTPILLLVFNRPKLTARVFAEIRAQKPVSLYVASDGARPGRHGEAELVDETRRIATAVDWPCEIRTLFRESNLGCGRAVSTAIRWFFDNVEEGIVLEDDCLPHQDFFRYCETLLDRYRDETKIATIAGTHFLPDSLSHRQTHYASKYFQMWGWASWRRAWRHYDFELQALSDGEWFQLLQTRHPIAIEAGYWREVLLSLRAGNVDTWDFQALFSFWRIGANHMMPGRNLISNLGYGLDATHTNFTSFMAEIPTHPLCVDDKPVALEPDPAVDNLIFYLRFLESLTHTWWIDQVISPDRQLADARTDLIRKNRRIRQLELELEAKRAQLRAAAKALAGIPVSAQT